MPLLGSTGNSSEYSFRGNYDDISTVINFTNYENVPLKSVYKTSQQIVEDINYKILVEVISGEAKILVSEQDIKIPTYDSTIVTFDETDFTFDSIDNLENYINLTTTSAILRPGNRFMLVLQPLSGEVVSSIDQYNNVIRVGGEEVSWNVSIQRISIAENLRFDNVQVSALTAFSGVSTFSNSYTIQGLSTSVNYTTQILSGNGFLNVNFGGNVAISSVTNGDVLTLNSIPSTGSGDIKSINLVIYSSGNVGLAQTTWTIETLRYTPDPNLFFFNNVLLAEPSTEIISDPILITNITDPNTKLIAYNCSISLNYSEFIPSTTLSEYPILNNTVLRLSTTSSNIWEQQINIPVFIGISQSSLNGDQYISIGESRSWVIKTRPIKINPDVISSSLLFALPLETRYGIYDVSPEVRTTSNQPQGARSTITLQNSPIISNERSKFYFSSGKFTNGNILVQTDPNNTLRSSNFTFSAFVFVSGFNFGGGLGSYIIYSSYKDTIDPVDFSFSIRIKGDNWSTDPNLRRGISVSLPVFGTNQENIILETRQQVLTPNTFHHIALVRSNNIFKLYVDGVNVGRTLSNVNSVSILSDFTGNNYRLGYSPQTITEDYYIQDARLYKGNALFENLNFFDVNTQVNSILEKRID